MAATDESVFAGLGFGGHGPDAYLKGGVEPLELADRARRRRVAALAGQGDEEFGFLGWREGELKARARHVPQGGLATDEVVIGAVVDGVALNEPPVWSSAPFPGVQPTIDLNREKLGGQIAEVGELFLDPRPQPGAANFACVVHRHVS